ncbi:MAG: hypothetical protein ACI4Q8_07150 [Ruminococcus sp.]
MAEIDSITRDALKRAQQMNSYSASPGKSAKQTRPPQISPDVPQQTPQEINTQKTEINKQNKNTNFLDMLLGNKEQSLILLLLVLLMNEDCDPTVLLALLYLLL